MSVNRIIDRIREIGMPEPQYGEPNETAFVKVSDAIEALLVVAYEAQEFVDHFTARAELHGGVYGQRMERISVSDPLRGLVAALSKLSLPKPGEKR